MLANAVFQVVEQNRQKKEHAAAVELEQNDEESEQQTHNNVVNRNSGNTSGITVDLSSDHNSENHPENHRDSTSPGNCGSRESLDSSGHHRPHDQRTHRIAFTHSCDSPSNDDLRRPNVYRADFPGMAFSHSERSIGRLSTKKKKPAGKRKHRRQPTAISRRSSTVAKTWTKVR